MTKEVCIDDVVSAVKEIVPRGSSVRTIPYGSKWMINVIPFNRLAPRRMPRLATIIDYVDEKIKVYDRRDWRYAMRLRNELNRRGLVNPGFGLESHYD